MNFSSSIYYSADFIILFIYYLFTLELSNISSCKVPFSLSIRPLTNSSVVSSSGYDEQSSNECCWASVSVISCSVLGYRPKSGIAGSRGRSISIFLRNCHSDFHSDCTSLHSHQQWMSAPTSNGWVLPPAWMSAPHPQQYSCHLFYWSWPFWLP